MGKGIPAVKRDNNTYWQKIALRRTGMGMLRDTLPDGDVPVVMETHGGKGDIYAACYADIEDGVVFEKDATKVERLTRQRETWAVYEADCEKALVAGAGGHLPINFLDADPYGSCWPALRGFFGSVRPFADVMVVAVNCGLTHSLAVNKGWDVSYLSPYIAHYGNHNMYRLYHDAVFPHMLADTVAQRGYEVVFFKSYKAGAVPHVVHALAKLVRKVDDAEN